MDKISNRKILIINQATNYLTVGLANAFYEKFEDVTLITGGIHEQGELLSPQIRVDKIKKYAQGSNKKKLFLYVISCIQIFWLLKTKYRKHEVFFVSLPPMGYLLNLLVSNKFSMLIWDIYPDTFKITGMSEKHLIYKIWVKLNKKSFQKATSIFTIGTKMAELLSQYVAREKLVVQPIWAVFQDDIKIPKEKNTFIETHGLKNKFIVQYSGNIGLTHNVETLIEIAEILNNNEVIHFQIIGKGARIPFLKDLVDQKKLTNVSFLPFQSDAMFPFSLSAADVGVVILDEITSKGSVPSKSYNLMSLGIPSLYIASSDSELYEYAKAYQHAKCFTKKELHDAANYLCEMLVDKTIYETFSKNALLTSQLFKRNNADKIVTTYITKTHDT